MKRKSKISVPNGFLAAIVLLIFVSGIATMLVSGHKLSEVTQQKSTQPEPVNTSSGNTLDGINSKAVSPNAFEEESNLPNGYRLVSVLNEEIYKGSLVLVNYQHESKIDGENLINIFENVTSSVGVKEDDMMINSVVIDSMNPLFDAFKEAKGKTSILISSSYRSKNDQQKIYDDSVKQTGKKSTAYYVAVPGFSEHQTGYCFDLAAINRDNEMIELDGEGDFSWLSENCADYGFVLRYPDDKTNITGIGYESWHFRYVGKAHSLFITKHKLCLEEYITGIQKYTFDNGGLLIDEGSKGKWLVYYVPKLEAFNNTDIPVPADSDKCPYTVSGDNIGGFIVTVDVSKDSSVIPEKAASDWSFDNSELIIKDFVDYDPATDTEDDKDDDEEEDTERDSDGNVIKKSSNDDDWENDSYWGDDDDSQFEYVDYYDDYDEDYSENDGGNDGGENNGDGNGEEE